MFVISKKALRFVKRDKDKAAVDTRIVRSGIMTQLPEWVKSDELFKLAEKEGSITFVDHQKNTRVGDVPDNGGESKLDTPVTGETDDPLKNDGGEDVKFLTPDEVSKMDRPALREYAAKIGVEGIPNNITDANLVLRINEFIAAKAKGD